MLGAQSTLESNYWFGAQGNRLWVGLVEGDGNLLIDGSELVDLNGSNRVKVRIMGYHTRSRSKLKPKDLPWSSIMIPATEAVTTSNAGITHGLEIGSWVIGTFLDGESAQSPLVLGSLGLVDNGPVKDSAFAPIAASQTEKHSTSGRGPTTESEDTSSQPGRGAANLGKLGAEDSAGENAIKGRQQTLAVANAKCGSRPESEFGRILQDLFKFVNQNDTVGDLLVNKLTGGITSTASVISNYAGRLVNSVNNLLGSLKALIVREVKKWLQKAFQGIITALQLPNGRGAASSKGIKTVKEFILEAIKCLFTVLLNKIANLIIDIVTSLVENVLNTAFCQISNILKGIVKEIQDGISAGLKAIGPIASIISKYGNFGGSFLKKIGNLVKQFCDGQLSCALGISSVTTGIGEKPDNAVSGFFNRLELFGDLPNEVNVGLYGSDSFLRSIENIKLRDSEGNVVTGTLNCNKATQFQWPMIPDIFFTGVTGGLDVFSFDDTTGIDIDYGDRNPIIEDYGLPVTINGKSVTIGGIGGTPITDINGNRVTVGGTGGIPVYYGGTGGTPLTVNGSVLSTPSVTSDLDTETSNANIDIGNSGGVPVTIDNIPVLVGSSGGQSVNVGGVAIKVGAQGGIFVKVGATGGKPVVIGTRVRRSDEQIFNDNPYPPTKIDGSNPFPTGIPAINSKGELVSVKITNPGFGLKNPPKISIFPVNDWGSGAQGFTTLNSNGGVDCVYITRQGGGYPYFDVSISTAEFVKTLQNGQPDYTKIAGIYTENPFWLGVFTKKCSPVVKATGSNYNETTKVIVEPGASEVNQVVLPELKPILTNGRLVGIEVVKEGFGFTTLPKVYLKSEDGSVANDRNAVIHPVIEYIPRQNAKDILSSYEEFREIIDCVGYPGD